MKNIIEIDQLLADSIERSEIPGAVYLLAEGKEVRLHRAVGQAVMPCIECPEGYPTLLDTIYDVASLTKPLITTLLLVKAVENGLLSFDDPIYKFFPEFNREDKVKITVRQLATHSAGFPAWQPLYILVKDKTQVINFIAEQPLLYEPSKKVIYTDLGFIILGKLLEAIFGNPLDQIASEEIFIPLGLASTFFNPPKRLRWQIAASERGNKFEKAMAADVGANYQKWRNELIWGEVHDTNALFLGGITGHAGLFSTALDIYKIAKEFLRGSRLLKEESLLLFSRNFTLGCQDARSIGWAVTTDENGDETSAGRALQASSFGHTGFTGVSLWIEPDKERIYILLTNRTHPVYKEFNANELRRRFHTIAQKAFYL